MKILILKRRSQFLDSDRCCVPSSVGANKQTNQQIETVNGFISVFIIWLISHLNFDLKHITWLWKKNNNAHMFYTRASWLCHLSLITSSPGSIQKFTSNICEYISISVQVWKKKMGLMSRVPVMTASFVFFFSSHIDWPQSQTLFLSTETQCIDRILFFKENCLCLCDDGTKLQL